MIMMRSQPVIAGWTVALICSLSLCQHEQEYGVIWGQAAAWDWQLAVDSSSVTGMTGILQILRKSRGVEADVGDSRGM